MANTVDGDDVSLYVSHIETTCFSNRNTLFHKEKQNVSVNETNKKHSIYQIVRLALCP